MKEYPKTVVLRKSVIGFAILGMSLIVILILYNLSTNKYANNEQNSTNNSHHMMANPSDLDWYKNGSKPVAPEIPNKSTVSNKVQETSMKKEENAPLPIQKDAVSSDLQKAMSASITSNQLTDEQEGRHTESSHDGVINSHGVVESENHKQSEKNAFLKDNQQVDPPYLMSMVRKPMSIYELQAGSVIPGALITGINSDLPGQITAQVTNNVFDTITGNNLLIPQGSKLVGLYDSQVAYGQERTLVVWKTIKFPNGNSLDLQGMPGIDLSGYAGFHDLVNNHNGKLFSSVLLMSVLSAGAQLSQPQAVNNPYAAPTVGQTIAQSLGTNIASTGTTLVNKNLNIQPTLEIRSAYQFNVEVTRDIIFPGSYQDD